MSDFANIMTFFGNVTNVLLSHRIQVATILWVLYFYIWSLWSVLLHWCEI